MSSFQSWPRCEITLCLDYVNDFRVYADRRIAACSFYSLAEELYYVGVNRNREVMRPSELLSAPQGSLNSGNAFALKQD